MTNSHQPLPVILKVEKKMNETEKGIKLARYCVTASSKKKMIWQLAGKQANYNTNTTFFKKYRGRK